MWCTAGTHDTEILIAAYLLSLGDPHNVLLTHQGPVSLRQYELVYSILARKQEFLVNFQALSHRNLRGIWTRKFTSAPNVQSQWHWNIQSPCSFETSISLKCERTTSAPINNLYNNWTLLVMRYVLAIPWGQYFNAFLGHQAAATDHVGRVRMLTFDVHIHRGHSHASRQEQDINLPAGDISHTLVFTDQTTPKSPGRNHVIKRAGARRSQPVKARLVHKLAAWGAYPINSRETDSFVCLCLGGPGIRATCWLARTASPVWSCQCDWSLTCVPPVALLKAWQHTIVSTPLVPGYLTPK